MPEELTLQVAAVSDPGLRRANNEDAVSWFDEREGASRATLLIVADGIGGAAAGEVASREAIELVQEEVAGHLAAGNILGRLRAAIDKANRHVYRLAESTEEYHGMGTTLSAAVIAREKLYVAHVGDSRVYLIRDGEAMQVSSDHTWIADEVESGRMTIDEAASHPARKAINRGVGISASVHSDTYGPLQLLEGDVVLLCTDGLHDVVPDEEIAHLASTYEPEEALPELVKLANSRGGPDNISVVAARLSAVAVAEPRGGGPVFDIDEDAALPVPVRPARGGMALLPAVWLPVAAVAVAAVLAIVLLTNGESANTPSDAGVLGPPAVTIRPIAASPTGVAGASATPAATTVAAPAPAACADDSPAILHKIASGDTFSGLEATYGLDTGAIEACNPDADPALLQTDQEINIPCGDRSCAEVAAQGQ